MEVKHSRKAKTWVKAILFFQERVMCPLLGATRNNLYCGVFMCNEAMNMPHRLGPCKLFSS